MTGEPLPITKLLIAKSIPNSHHKSLNPGTVFTKSEKNRQAQITWNVDNMVQPRDVIPTDCKSAIMISFDVNPVDKVNGSIRNI